MKYILILFLITSRSFVSEITSLGLTVSKIVTEIGSGLNGHRPKLKKLLADPLVHKIAVELPSKI